MRVSIFVFHLLVIHFLLPVHDSYPHVQFFFFFFRHSWSSFLLFLEFCELWKDLHSLIALFFSRLGFSSYNFLLLSAWMLKMYAILAFDKYLWLVLIHHGVTFRNHTTIIHVSLITIFYFINHMKTVQIAIHLIPQNTYFFRHWILLSIFMYVIIVKFFSANTLALSLKYLFRIHEKYYSYEWIDLLKTICIHSHQWSCKVGETSAF